MTEQFTPLGDCGDTRIMAPRVLRGGTFNNNARNVRCAYRNNNDPDNRNNNIGFRVVLSTWVAGNARRYTCVGATRLMAACLPGRVSSETGQIATAPYPGLKLGMGHLL